MACLTHRYTAVKVRDTLHHVAPYRSVAAPDGSLIVRRGLRYFDSSGVVGRPCLSLATNRLHTGRGLARLAAIDRHLRRPLELSVSPHIYGSTLGDGLCTTRTVLLSDKTTGPYDWWFWGTRLVAVGCV
jgi:hypothetical protein